MEDERDFEPSELKGKEIENLCLNQDPIDMVYDEPIYFDKYVKGMRETNDGPAGVFQLHFFTDDSSKDGIIEIQIRYDKPHPPYQYHHYNVNITYREIYPEPEIYYNDKKFNHTRQPPISGFTIEPPGEENYSVKLKVSGAEHQH